MPGLAGEVANLIVALKLDDSGFSGKLNAAARQLKGMDAGLSKIGTGVGQVGTGLGKLATTAGVVAVGGLTAAITTAASMEEAFTGVEKTVDASDAKLEELRQTIRTLSSETGTAFEDLARIGEAGGALGVPTEDLDEFIDVVNRLGVSTNLSTDQAATALGQLRTILGLSGEEMRTTADALVALGNSGASTEDQIVEMAARFAAAGNSAGLGTDEILALSSAVASMGIEVEAGGGSLSRLFNDTTTNIGVANDEATAFADALGLTFDQFKKAWDDDALGTFQDLLEHLGELDQFEGAALLADLGITNTRDINALQLMAQNYEFVGEQLEVAADAQGALNTESDKFFGTGAAGFRRLRENVRLTADTIGTELLPVVNDLISDFITELQTPETQAGIKNFAEDLADGIRDFVDAAGDVDWGPIISGLEFAGTVAKGVLDLFKSLPGPLQGLIVGGIALNKLSGGGVADILKGVGNIALGGGKLFARGNTPASPLFVKEVGLPGTGGPVPIGGGKGGGILGNLWKILPPLIAAELANEFNKEFGDEFFGSATDLRESLGFEGIDVDFLDDLQWPFGPKNAPAWARFDSDSPFTDPPGFAGQLPGAPGGGGPPPGFRPVDDAASFDQNLLQHAVRQGVQELPDTSMLQTQIGRVVTELSPIRTAEQQALATQFAHLSAVREVGDATRTGNAILAGKQFDPTIVVPINLNISTSMYQQQVARASAARQGATAAPRLE